MHVVISGYYGFDNVGDEAILFSIIEAMRKVQPNINITVLSNSPEKTAKTYGVNAVNRWSFSEVSRAIKSADGLISGGGSLLQDETGIKSIPYYTGIIRIAHWYKKPTFVYAQGMGPIRRWISKWIVKSTLNRVHAITVRDYDSKALLEDIGIKKEMKVVPDPVLGLDGSKFTNEWTKELSEVRDAASASAADATATSNQHKPNKFITVSVRDWPTEQPYLQKIADCLDRVVQSGYDVVFVPMHGEIDEATSQKAATLMREKSYVSPGELSIEEKVSIIGESEVLIGIRLHALIFAAVNHVPFIALSYDPKIDSFAAICEQPIVGHIAKEDWDADKLFNQVKRALDYNPIQRDIIKNKVEIYQQQALQTPKLVLETFK